LQLTFFNKLHFFNKKGITMKRLFALLVTGGFLFAATSCAKTSEAAEETMDAAGEAIETAVEETEEVIEEAEETTEEVVDDAEEATEDATEEVEATVEETTETN
jgi:gas vesicle protein